MSEETTTKPAPVADRRIYIVETKREDGNTAQRLVRARNPSQARDHVIIEPVARLASQDELVELVAAGIEVEDAK